MANINALMMRASARRMVEKFGFREVSIDEFDMFIIDEKLADDPGTSNKSDPHYRAFIQDRTSARNKLNLGAELLEEEKFAIVIAEAGIMYSLVPWAEAAKMTAGSMAMRVRKFAINKAHSVDSLGKKASQLAIEYNDDGLHEAAQMIKQMSVQADALGFKVAALEHQYNTAFEKVSAEVKKRIAQYDEAAAANPILEVGSGN